MVEGHELIMGVDTGTAVSIISEDTMNSYPFLKDLQLHPTSLLTQRSLYQY